VQDVSESTRAEGGTRTEPAVGAGDERPPRPSTERLASRLFLVSVVAAIVPVAVATTRAIYQGWIPIGDHGLFAIRARDLFSYTHLPLIGTWSSASLTIGTHVNHPGPLYFDLLAVPARLSDSGAGVAFGVGLINSLCIVGIAWFGYRRGGPLVGTVAMAATAALSWTMGSVLLFEPWNPHSTMLPFMFFLVLVWSMTSGDLLAVPFAAGVGSLVMQTHLSYAAIVPLLGVWGALGLVISIRGQRRRDPGAWPQRRTRALRLGAAGAGVAVVCWLQPLIEQFTSDGSGNLTRLVDSAGSSSKAIGQSFGTRVVATVVSLPPWWFRPSMREQFASDWDAPSLGVALISLAVLGALLAWCAWDAGRRRDRVSSWAIATAIVGVLVALVTAGRGPVTVFGLVTGHTFRWLWPLSVFVFLAIAVTLGRRFARDASASIRSVSLVGVFALATLSLAALNLPHSDQGSAAVHQEYAVPAAKDLTSHMGSLEDEGPLLIDDVFAGSFANPYSASVVEELQRRGIPFVAADPGLVRQFGPARQYNGHNAKAALLFRQGDATLEAPPGTRGVARGEGLSRADQRELYRLQAEIDRYIQAGRLRLNAKGQAALERGDLPKLVELQSQGPGADPQALFTSGEIDKVMIRRHLLALEEPWTGRFDRYADLKRRSDLQTVALFLGPLPPGQSAAEGANLNSVSAPTP
jgi:hypothetical protein